MKKVIRLTENELIKVIKKLIKENDNEMTRDSERFGKNVEDNGMIRDLIVWTPGYEMEQLEKLFGTFLTVKEPYEIEDDDISPKSERYKYYVVDLNFNKLKELLNNKTRYTVDDPYDASGYFNIEKDGGRAIINFDIGNDSGEISKDTLERLFNITESKIIKVIRKIVKEQDNDDFENDSFDEDFNEHMITLDYIAGQLDEDTTEEELEYLLDEIEYELGSIHKGELPNHLIDELITYGNELIEELIKDFKFYQDVSKHN